MPEYIERESLFKFLTGQMIRKQNGAFAKGFNKGIMVARAAVHNKEITPSADVIEVVRCKNCKHFCPYEGEEHKGDCAELVGLESCVYEDDFCSYGERRSN